MDRSEVYPLVFIGLVIMFYSAIASSALVALNFPDETIEQPVIPGYIPLNSYTSYEVYDGSNSTFDGKRYYNVTNPPEGWWVSVTGYEDIQIMTNQGTSVLIQFIKKDEGAWFNLPSDLSIVRFSQNDLTNKIQDINNDIQLNVDIKLEKHFMISFVSFPGDTIYEGITNYEFSVVVSEYSGNVSEEDKNALDTFKELVTFNIPGVPFVLSFLIASPITILGTYLIVRIILMFIPLVPGGG